MTEWRVELLQTSNYYAEGWALEGEVSPMILLQSSLR